MMEARLALVGAASLALTAAFSVACTAEDLIVEDPGPAMTEAQPVPAKPNRQGTAPAVYGWSSVRPGDCGIVSYWDGQRCIDTRTEKQPANN